VAWAKSRFETYFSSEVQLLVQLRDIISSHSSSAAGEATSARSEADRLEQVRAWLGTLSEDQVQGVLRALEDRPWTTQGAEKVSIGAFAKFKI